MPAPSMPAPNTPGFMRSMGNTQHARGGLGMSGMGNFLTMNEVGQANYRPYASGFLTTQQLAPGAAQPLNPYGQQFNGMGALPAGQGAYLTEGELRQTAPQAWQGPWLTMNQVRPGYVDPMRRVVGHPQAFGGLGQGGFFSNLFKNPIVWALIGGAAVYFFTTR